MARHIHCGINVDPTNPHGRPSVQQIQDLGATWVRFTFKDDSDGPQPTRFAFYDDLVGELNQAGINILMILSNETCPGRPARDADEAACDAYIAKFAARCRQIAQHYGSQVQAYEIWNEPDFLAPSPDYDPCMGAEVFGRLLRAAFAAIKEVSSATVVMGGLAAGQPGYLEEVRASTNGVLHVDAVGVHPYGRRPTEDWPRPDWGFGVLGDLIRQYHAAAGKPVWITEVGTDDTSVQDEFPQRTFDTLNGDLAAMAPCVFWFCWSDGMVSPFGLVDADGRRKASYASFREFASLPFEEPVADPEQLLLELLRAELGDQFEDIRDSLPTTGHYPSRPLEQIHCLAIHHTGTPVGTWSSTIARDHVENRGWPAIGYHFLVYRRKVRYCDSMWTSHRDAWGLSAETVDVAFVGDHDAEAPTDQAIELAARLLELLEQYLGRPVAREAHRDLALPGYETTSPGQSGFGPEGWLRRLGVTEKPGEELAQLQARVAELEEQLRVRDAALQQIIQVAQQALQ